ncbi:hypothetical protein RIF29_21021 [Crotalaria pallida]|uniref:Uncharacterized protein n=1 Tax=Crotalaria pallida TaxID=3830 RepID=A0AAN9FAR8_CROPI
MIKRGLKESKLDSFFDDVMGFVMNLQPSEAEAGFHIRMPPTADQESLERRIAEEWAPISHILVLDLRSSTWSKIEAKAGVESTVDSSSSATITPCADHSLVCIEKVPFLFEKLQTSLSAIFNVVILVDSTSSGIVWILMMETL